MGEPQAEEEEERLGEGEAEVEAVAEKDTPERVGEMDASAAEALRACDAVAEAQTLGDNVVEPLREGVGEVEAQEETDPAGEEERESRALAVTRGVVQAVALMLAHELLVRDATMERDAEAQELTVPVAAAVREAEAQNDAPIAREGVRFALPLRSPLPLAVFVAPPPPASEELAEALAQGVGEPPSSEAVGEVLVLPDAEGHRELLSEASALPDDRGDTDIEEVGLIEEA